jgi:hypothetical protein
VDPLRSVHYLRPKAMTLRDAAARATSRDEETRLLAEAAEFEDMADLLERGGDKPGRDVPG